MHPASRKAPEAHPQKIIDKDCFSRDPAGGQSLSARVAARVESFGYNYCAVGETQPGAPQASAP